MTLPQTITIHPAAEDLAPRAIAPDAPAPAQVWVEIDAAVFAAPEVAALAARHPVAPGGAAVGRVVEAGEAARHLVGARCLVGPIEACGECARCRRGHPSLCPSGLRRGVDAHGALASHVLAAARWIVPLEGVLAGAPAGPEAALLAREAPLCYELLARAGVAAGEATLWLGDPVLSALGARIAEAKGARGIVIERERLAEAGPKLLAERLEATRGAGEAEPTDVRVFETSGAPEAIRAALALAPDGATVGFLAAPRSDAPLGDVLARELTLFSVGAPHADLVPEVVALAVRGELPLAGLVPETIALPREATRIWVRRAG